MVFSRSAPRLASSLLACVLLLVSCSMMKSSTSDGGRDMPSWFLEDRPMDPHHIFAAATATAPKLELASNKAANTARGNLAAMIETRFQGLTKQFQEETGQGPNAKSVSQFTQAYKSVVSRTIRGSEVVKREIKREGEEYRAYVLMRMPIGKAQEKLLQQIQAQENAFTRFRSSQAFKELEQEVDGYHQRQKEQEARRQGRASGKQAQTTEESTNAQVKKRDAQGAKTRNAGDAPTEDQVQAPEQQDTDAQVEERKAKAGETRETGNAPSKDQVQAPEKEAEQQTGQQQGGGGQTSKAKKIERRVRAAAEPWMGTPYKFGGETKDGVDCSGLTQALYEEAFNVDLPRTTGKQEERGQKVRKSQMRAGDLIFFRNDENGRHVGIYLENGKFVHASSSQGVTISPMKYDYWQNNYWKTKRLSVL